MVSLIVFQFSRIPSIVQPFFCVITLFSKYIFAEHKQARRSSEIQIEQTVSNVTAPAIEACRKRLSTGGKPEKGMAFLLKFVLWISAGRPEKTRRPGSAKRYPHPYINIKLWIFQTLLLNTPMDKVIHIMLINMVITGQINTICGSKCG